MAGPRTRKTGTTLADVARLAGVSKMTASRVLRDVEGFSSTTRDKVLSAVDRLGYVPDRIAAAFGTVGASTLVGVCVPRLTSDMFGSVLDSIDRTLSRFGHQTMIGAHENATDMEEAWLRTILSWRPAGVILSARTHSSTAIELLKSHAVPVVEIWNLNTSPLDISVGFNHFDCGHEMGRFVVGRGRRRIAYVGAEAGAASTAAVRLEGFEQALHSAGIELATREILIDRPGFYAGYYGTETVLNRVGNIDAIHYQDDAMAVGGLFYCRSKGLDVPGDIGIAGWGGMEVASVLPQRLTTTTVATQSLGKSAAEALMARIRGEPVQDVIVVPTRLVPGSTI